MRARKLYYGWVVLGATTAASFLTAGATFSVGLFIIPLSKDLGWSVAAISLGISLRSLLSGFMQPFMGRLADRYGPRAVLGLGLLAIGTGTALLATVSHLWQFYFYGSLVMLGGAGAAQAALVARWFRQRRGLAMSIQSSGMAAGQLVMMPLVGSLILAFGWRWSYAVLGAVVLGLAAPLVIALVRNDPSQAGSAPAASQGKESPATSQPSRNLTPADDRQPQPVGYFKAMGTHTYISLALGFSICGLTTVGLLHSHLAPYATEEVGISPRAAAGALGLMGGVSILGIMAAGMISDRVGRKWPLASFYFLRALAYLLLLFVTTEWQLYLVTIVLGLTSIGTVPPVASLVADTYGPRLVGALYGTILMAHSVGAAVGAFYGGVIFDATGSYHWAFFTAIPLLLVATAITLQIRERAKGMALATGIN